MPVDYSEGRKKEIAKNPPMMSMSREEPEEFYVTAACFCEAII